MRTRATIPSLYFVDAHSGQYKLVRDSQWIDEHIPTQSFLTGTNEFIADAYPHKREVAFQAMEHFKVGASFEHGATSCYAAGSSEDRCPATIAGLHECRNYRCLHIRNTWDQLYDVRYRPNLPWWSDYYSAGEAQSWAATFAARLARWGLGRGGLSESLGEMPEMPKLWHFIQKGKGYYRNVNNAYLAYMFGYRPLLDLIPDVMQEISDFRNKIRPKAERKPGLRTLVFRLPIRPPWVEPEMRVTSDPCGYKWPQVKRFSNSQLRFTRCEAIGMYNAVVTRRPFTGYEIINRLADLDGLPNFRTVWELVPMSFVVDYFVGIGDLISRMQGNLLYDINVDQAALGVRIEASGLITSQYGVGNVTTSRNGELRYYCRQPMPTGFVALSLPGHHAIPTGIALAMQRCPRLPKRLTAATKRALARALRSKFGRYVTDVSSWGIPTF